MPLVGEHMGFAVQTDDDLLRVQMNFPMYFQHLMIEASVLIVAPAEIFWLFFTVFTLKKDYLGQRNVTIYVKIKCRSNIYFLYKEDEAVSIFFLLNLL